MECYIPSYSGAPAWHPPTFSHEPYEHRNVRASSWWVELFRYTLLTSPPGCACTPTYSVRPAALLPPPPRLFPSKKLSLLGRTVGERHRSISAQLVRELVRAAQGKIPRRALIPAPRPLPALDHDEQTRRRLSSSASLAEDVCVNTLCLGSVEREFFRPMSPLRCVRPIFRRRLSTRSILSKHSSNKIFSGH